MKETIKKPLVSEKSSKLIAENKYTFVIGASVNKIEIKEYIEKKYGVEVTAVNTIKLPPKKRTRGRIIGYGKGVRKAVVSVKEGSKAETLKKLF